MEDLDSRYETIGITGIFTYGTTCFRLYTCSSRTEFHTNVVRLSSFSYAGCSSLFFSNEIRSIYSPKKRTRPKSISSYLSIDTPNFIKKNCYNLYVTHKTKVTLFSIPLDTILENTKTTSRCKSLEHIPDRSDRTINFY